MMEPTNAEAYLLSGRINQRRGDQEAAKGSAALEAEDAAGKFARSLKIPVYLQDERLSSVEAEEQLRAAPSSDDGTD